MAPAADHHLQYNLSITTPLPHIHTYWHQHETTKLSNEEMGITLEKGAVANESV